MADWNVASMRAEAFATLFMLGGLCSGAALVAFVLGVWVGEALAKDRRADAIESAIQEQCAPAWRSR